MGIGVQAAEFIPVLRQRIEKGLLIEAACDHHVVVLARARVKIGEHLAHSAVLGFQDTLHVLVAEPSGVGIDPARHPFNDVQRLGIAGVHVHVEQAGHDFVNGVERSPHAHPLPQTVEKLRRERAQIAILVCVLALRQRSHQRVALLLKVTVARAGVGQCHCREIVAAAKVAAQF